MSYLLTGAADMDLMNILLDGIDRFGVAQASSYRSGLEGSFNLIGDHPRMARLRTEITPPLRVLPHRSHIILYEIDEDGVAIILRIRHGREDWITDPL